MENSCGKPFSSLRQALDCSGAVDIESAADFNGRFSGSLIRCSFQAHELECAPLSQIVLLAAHEYHMKTALFDLGWGYREHFVNFVHPLHVIPPGTPLRWYKDGPARVSLLLIDEGAALDMFGELAVNDPVDGLWSLAQRGFSDPLIYAALESMSRDCDAGRLSTLLSDSFGTLVLNELGRRWCERRAGGGASKLDPQTMRKVRAYMADHLAEDLSLAELAALCGLSRYHFLRCFKASADISPYQYLTALRVEKAKHLLGLGRTPAAYVAAQCGFASTAAMSRALRKATGRPASAHRQAVGNRRSGALPGDC